MEHFEDIGPSVVLASPGMMQSGLSRELFENWCTDKRNGCIIAGYCVEGTLAKVMSYNKNIIPLFCNIKCVKVIYVRIHCNCIVYIYFVCSLIEYGLTF